jgi:pyrimidine operon attenuation protein/uracil phosphoribosyltransferase
LTVTRDKANRAKIIGWKLSTLEDEGQTATYADELAALIEKAIPVRPSGCVLTIPPQGASWPGTYYARLLGRHVANRLRMPLLEIIARTDEKHHHGRRASLGQEAYVSTMAVPAAIVIDDLITSGRTMKLALDALRAAEVPCWGFALNGS